MKKITSLLAIIILLPISLQGQSPTYIILGTNISYLRTEDGKSKPGICMGIGKDFYPISSLNGFLGLDLTYTTKRFKLGNKTWPSSMDIEFSDVSTGDIPLDRSYLEFRAEIGYRIPLFHNKAAMEFSAGPELLYPIKYLSRILSDSSIFLDPNERGKYKVDYLRCESEGADNLLNWSMGIAINYRRYGIEIRYERAWSRQRCIRGLTINDALDSVHFLLRYSL